MPEYLSPGVYVEEVPSAVKPIAGVSTSTAGFIGLVPDALPIPPTMVKTKRIPTDQVDGSKTTFDLDDYPVVTTSNTYKVLVEGQPTKSAQLKNDATTGKSQLVFSPQYPAAGTAVTVSYKYTGATDTATDATDEPIPAEKVTGQTDTFDLVQGNAQGNKVSIDQSVTLKVNGVQVAAKLQQKTAKGPVQVVIVSAPKVGAEISVDYTIGPRVGQQIGTWNGTDKRFKLPTAPVVTDSNSFKVQVGDSVITSSLENRVENGNPVVYATITGDIPATVKTGDLVTADYISFQIFKTLVGVGQTKLCTNFTEYKNAFGDFTLDPGHRKLTQAVYGFFNNGGTRCYVSRITGEGDMDAALKAFELVDDIAIVAAPGLSTDNIRSKLVAHCRNMGDRFAILDGPDQTTDLITLTQGSGVPARTDYAAWYFPWIKVFDPVSQKYENNPKGTVSVPPSGHIAGIYARVDNERGVHKAPANEAILGALDVTQRLSKAHQDGLNPKGVNCIRVLNDNILVWGARTIGGDANADVKYINVRRTLLFLRKSIDEGTQWVVFEPNSPALWQKITRNVTAFLTNVWRSGALFGNTPQEAFYVKCDKETNSQSAIDNGQVVTEIGVAIVRPAEFVIFRISQMAGPGA
jgi:phage tail sheath protein FI